MKRTRPILILSILSFVFFACERPAEINLGIFTPELVVLANFSELDTLEVIVSKSQPILTEGPVEYVSDATVELFIDGFFADRFQFVPSPVPQLPAYYLSTDIVPQSGLDYRLRVEAPGFESVEGTCTLPFPVEVDTANLFLFIEIEELDAFNSQANITVNLKVQDEKNIPNYYHLNFYQKGFDFSVNGMGDTIKTSFFSLPLVTTSEDNTVPLIPYIEDRGVLFTDNALENNQGGLIFSSTFQYRPGDQLLGDFLIELRTTSPEYYHYHRSLAQQFQAGLDPFSEPVILYSNIEDGQGVFAGFVTRFYSIE